jgi:hypothetical protein
VEGGLAEEVRFSARVGGGRKGTMSRLLGELSRIGGGLDDRPLSRTSVAKAAGCNYSDMQAACRGVRRRVLANNLPKDTK